MNILYTRKLASIQLINGVYPIENADKICQYGINGWRVVDQVGKYQTGDLVIFIEVDSFVPTTLAPFLTKPGKFPKIYLGVEGERLRTIKLRGALSQGLILPLTAIGEYPVFIEKDLTEQLSIQKWEPPPEFTSADARGSFPSFIPKSDQERIQNCFRNIEFLGEGFTAEVQEKVEGQSHTAYLSDGEFGVCSRNLNLRDSDNTFWNTARKYRLEEKLRSYGKNIAIQSEQVGPGIQGNIYSLADYHLFVFDIFDIDTGFYLQPYERRALTRELGLTDAPVLEKQFSLNSMSLEQYLVKADGTSVLGTTNTLREGLVYKVNNPTEKRHRVSFKTISNKYLLGQKD